MLLFGVSIGHFVVARDDWVVVVSNCTLILFCRLDRFYHWLLRGCARDWVKKKETKQIKKQTQRKSSYKTELVYSKVSLWCLPWDKKTKQNKKTRYCSSGHYGLDGLILHELTGKIKFKLFI